ncbi:MAG TPA: hypothetical protein VGQ07_06440 [Nitrospirales bacterium]|jgi:hypothetical protein|nr:hypothetical protein [Nitrospirales bacterium]
MNRRWSDIVTCLAVGAILGGCQGTDALRLTNLPSNESVTLAPVVNVTGRSLSLPPDNPLTALRQELGLGDETPVTISDVLANRLLLAFQSHGYQVTRIDKARQAFSDRSTEIAKVVEEARATGLKGLILLTTLRRWDDSRWVDTRAVFVSMDVTVARISDGVILDARTIRNQTVPVGAAMTIVQASDDAARWLAERLF